VSRVINKAEARGWVGTMSEMVARSWDRARPKYGVGTRRHVQFPQQLGVATHLPGSPGIFNAPKYGRISISIRKKNEKKIWKWGLASPHVVPQVQVRFCIYNLRRFLGKHL